MNDTGRVKVLNLEWFSGGGTSYPTGTFAQDQLYIAPVPEPETYAMMLAGTGFVGCRRPASAQARVIRSRGPEKTLPRRVFFSRRSCSWNNFRKQGSWLGWASGPQAALRLRARRLLCGGECLSNLLRFVPPNTFRQRMGRIAWGAIRGDFLPEIATHADPKSAIDCGTRRQPYAPNAR